MRRIILKQELKVSVNESSESVFISEETLRTDSELPDKYMDKIIKLVPSEIIAAFIAINNLIDIEEGAYMRIHWIVFFILLIATPFYISKITKRKDLPVLKSQILISTIAFTVWVFALGGPFRYLNWYDSIYGSIFMILFTALSPLFIVPNKD